MELYWFGLVWLYTLHIFLYLLLFCRLDFVFACEWRLCAVLDIDTVTDATAGYFRFLPTNPVSYNSFLPFPVSMRIYAVTYYDIMGIVSSAIFADFSE